MEKKTITVYKLNELPKDIQDKIISEWRNNDEFFWGSEIVDCLKYFCDEFDIKLKDYRLGGQGENIFIEIDNDIKNLSYIRAYKYLNNNYINSIKKIENNEITGICYDYDIGKPILDFIKKPYDTTIKRLFQDCMHATITCYNNELNNWYSDDQIIEEIEMNDYDFTIFGQIFNEKYI